MEKIRVVLPKKINLVVGDTFQLFYRAVVDAPNPYAYDIFAVCERGRNLPRYFEILPEKEGEYELTLYVCGPGKVLLGEGKTILSVHKPVSPKKPFNILCIGDSTTAGGEWIGEANRRLTAKGGTPEGNGLDNINFIGEEKKNGAHCEAFGGWRWDNFVSTDVKNGMWVNCVHKKTAADQHSLWKDDNGNLWQLETFEGHDFIKFNRYMDHSGPFPEKGKLTHFNNANNQDDIVIKFISAERPSPFLDLETKKLDFKSYCKRNGYDGIDLVYIMLGRNGLHQSPTPQEHIKKNIEYGKILVSGIHSAYPNAKVVVTFAPAPSVKGGNGSNYGATLPFGDRYGIARFGLDTNVAYEAWSEEKEYSDYLDYINVGLQFDVENSYPVIDKPVNLRSTVTEEFGTNGVHPTIEGYMQLADAFYRDMIARINEFNSL